jgi:SET domain-containing protein
MTKGLVIRSSAIHAAGCYTTRALRKGQRICEYDGPRMAKAEADARYAERFVTYLFGFGTKGDVIDGFGTAMFINHSCAPNCESEEDADERIYIVALRAIKAGEELTFEYNLYDSEDDEQRCFCGASTCRGTMLAPAEVERRTQEGSKRKTKG